MAIFNQFPWTNFREYNLDWVVRTVKSALENVSDAVSTYFADHIDTTLTQSGDAADAAVTGTRIANNASNITNLQGRMTTAEGKITTLESEHTTNVKIIGSNGSYMILHGDVSDVNRIVRNHTIVTQSTLMDLGVITLAASNLTYAYEMTSGYISGASTYVSFANGTTLKFEIGTITEVPKPALDAVIIDASVPDYNVGSYAVLKDNTDKFTMTNVWISDSNGYHTIDSWGVSGTTIYLRCADAQPSTFACADDGTITAS